MAILSLQGVGVAFGGLPVLDGIDLRIEAGERVCLVGRNGVGKSTIIRLLAGEIAPDQGAIVRSQGLTTANLPQEVPSGLNGTVFDLVAGGLGRTAEALAEYHRLSAKADDDRLLGRLARLQQTLESDGGWQLHQRVESALTRLGLPPDAEFSNLSAGLKRLVLLARALVGQPDILLLDEPTNHLDIGAVARLEEYMLKHPGTVVFVTHDRMLLRRLATRIVEIDRGRLFDWACDYDTFLARKSEALATEAMQEEKFDKKLAEEEAWLRRGLKARRTRNEGRVRALETMRVLREARRERTGTVRMQLHEAEKTGKLVIEATGLGFSYGDRAILRDFSTTIMRGDKIGIIGPNGCGKSTLLRLLLGELPPQQGRIRHGVRLLPAYFDQLRAQLDETKTVQENVGDGKDTLTINGQPRHVIGYLQDFLFSPEQARGPVSRLSGGERNRLLLARLFARPSNVLILDEPTNDLDTETLELLEELLIGYSGTILVVSHDRTLLNNVVTSTLVFEGSGRVAEYVGGYDDWRCQLQASASPEKERPAKAPKPRPQKERPRKLTYKERQELEALPERIEALEAEQAALYATMGDPAFYQKDGHAVAAARDRLKAVEAELAEAYARWETLEAIEAGEGES